MTLRRLMIICLLAGCSEAPVEVEDVTPEVNESLCGGEECGELETCGLFDFQEACMCGVEGPCPEGKECWAWRSGKVSCEPPIATGKKGCALGEKECGPGDICISHSPSGGTICASLCKTADMMCADGSYCIGLLAPPRGESQDGFCNVGGGVKPGDACTTSLDCVATAFCVGVPEGWSECFLPCRPGKGDCPYGKECIALIGTATKGACL